MKGTLSEEHGAALVEDAETMTTPGKIDELQKLKAQAGSKKIEQ